MTVDHLLDHLTEPSTIRGIAWSLGSLAALWCFAKGQWETGAQVFATTGAIAGAIGVITSDRARDPRADG